MLSIGSVMQNIIMLVFFLPFYRRGIVSPLHATLPFARPEPCYQVEVDNMDAMARP